MPGSPTGPRSVSAHPVDSGALLGNPEPRETTGGPVLGSWSVGVRTSTHDLGGTYPEHGASQVHT